MATNQYDQALNYEKEARSIKKKLKRSGVEIERSERQSKLQQEAAELFVKKCAVRRVAEFTITEVQIGTQLAVRMALPFIPWGNFIVATKYANYKVKK